MPVSLLTLFREAASGTRRLAVVSLHDAPAARLACDAGTDLILVGDSVGNTLLGYESTLSVTQEDMRVFTGAVARGTRASQRPHVPIISDLPIGASINIGEAAKAALELLRLGAHAVKLEGMGPITLAAVEALTEMGAPVVAHIGYTPQSALRFEGVVQGKTAESARQLIDGALALEKAGCCAIVLEAVVAEVAEEITARLSIPTIGIGAGIGCSGQVLVWHDLVGLSPGTPFRFVKRFGNAAEVMENAARAYVTEVQNGTFPTDEHGWRMKDDEKAKWQRTAAESITE
jgi:3-methyl-2-oxobutanoate hydroxymethyltransferase